MGRQRISDDHKELVISMSLQGLPASKIHEYTGMSVCSIRRFRSTFHRTGSIVSPPSITVGRPRILTAIQVKVSMHYPVVLDVVSLSQFLRDCVERQPDIALMELQMELREACHIEMSLPTIMRSLKREGYTMKTVHYAVFIQQPHHSHDTNHRSRVMPSSKMSKTARSTRPSLLHITIQNNSSSPTRAISIGLLSGGHMRGHFVASVLTGTSFSFVAPSTQCCPLCPLMGSYILRSLRRPLPATTSSGSSKAFSHV